MKISAGEKRGYMAVAAASNAGVGVSASQPAAVAKSQSVSCYESSNISICAVIRK
jgi:hypothetical protein